MLPTWKGNLAVFGLLVVIVLSYFFWQLQQTHRTFLRHVREHSKMLAGVIEVNARGAVLSQDLIEETMQTFLGNMARFVDYLDTVEPFWADELSAFAKEAGLAGIRIIRENNIVEGPPGWIDPSAISSADKNHLMQHQMEGHICNKNIHTLRHLPESHLYFLTWPKSETPKRIIVGLTAAHIEELHEQVSLSYLIDTLSGITGIQYVRIEKLSEAVKPVGSVLLVDNPGGKIAETRLSLGSDILVVGLNAKHFFVRVDQLQDEFFVFSAILAMLGIFFSWLLHHYQSAYLKRIRDVERELARQREDAALGRAAASITHEIRNPLNAISMGLQRFQIEADDLDEEYQELVRSMLKAVQRTNGIVSNIRRYARPLEPEKKPVFLKSVIRHILSLYSQKCREYYTEVKCDIRYEEAVPGDSDMLTQVVENLFKNAVEAMPADDPIHISLDRHKNDVVLSIENSGFHLSPDEADRIIEPYFTTKTRGTGLGLAIVRRIVQAHGGRLEIRVPNDGWLRMLVYLPLEDNDKV